MSWILQPNGHRKIAFVLVIGVLFSLMACSFEKADSLSQEPIGEATRLIDRGQAAEAAVILEKYLATAPQNREARMLLSNAYASQAGLNFQRFVPLMKHYLDESEGKANHRREARPIVRLLRQSKSQTGLAAAQAIEIFDRTLETLDSIVDAYEKIPEITAEQYPYFLKALEVAGSAREISRGDALYRVMLLSVSLKYGWSVQGRINFMTSDCQLNTTSLNDFVDFTHFTAKGIFADLGLAYPKLAPKLNQDMTQFEALLPDFKSRLQTMGYFRLPPGTEPSSNPRAVWECL